METGTFDKQGDGSLSNKVRPNFETAPGGPLGYIPLIWEQISETSLTMTVRYQPQ